MGYKVTLFILYNCLRRLLSLAFIDRILAPFSALCVKSDSVPISILPPLALSLSNQFQIMGSDIWIGFPLYLVATLAKPIFDVNCTPFITSFTRLV